MLELVKTIFMILGAYVFGVFIYATVRVLINRFNRWRKNGCKIKCLCKPHIYKFYCHPKLPTLYLNDQQYIGFRMI